MAGRTPSPPTPPDPMQTAQAQGQINADAARLSSRMNRVNQATPFGSLTYNDLGARWAEDYTRQMQERFNRGEYTPGANNGQFVWADEFNSALRSDANPNRDRWEVVQTLSPAEQRQLDMSNQAQDIYGRAALAQLGRVEGTLSQPFQFNGPAMLTDFDFGRYGDPNVSRDRVEGALMQRLRPQLDLTRSTTETQLRNQGIMPGTEAWTNAIRDVNTQENDALLGAILNAGQEQNRIQALAANDMNQRNAARRMSFEEQVALRQMPLNEAAALLSGSAVQMPQFQQTPQVNVQPADYQGAAAQNYAGQMQQWQTRAQQAAQQNAMAGQLLGTVLGAGIGGMGGFAGLGAALGGGFGSAAPTLSASQIKVLR